ncbi:hypothetical protein B0H11DRAFT_2279033 [Mycena galericulata]|nr:hypothetical protein B0H11DRAFT_2279033 [Mycena galericulata]
MDDETFRDGGFSSNTTINDPSASSYAGAFFPRSRQLIVAGGTFTSNVTHNICHAAPSIPTDIRRIPWGDIDLRHEIKLDRKSGVTHRERGRGFVRRMYQARIEGREADMTVAVYEGDNENADFSDASVYMRSKSHATPLCVECRFWIRCSTNRLCVELPIYEVEETMFLNGSSTSWSNDTKIHPNDPNQETKLIDSVELGRYHTLCGWHLRKQRDFRMWGTEREFDIGAVICCPAGSQLESSAKIAVLANIFIHPMGWFTIRSLTDSEETMEDGWTRYNGDDVFGEQIECLARAELSEQQEESWLAQANSVFTHFQITSNHEDYCVVIGTGLPRDVARHLGYPLYRLFSEIEISLDREVADEEEEGSDDTTSIHDEDVGVEVESDNHAKDSGGELYRLPAQISGHDFWSIPNFNSSDFLSELPSSDFRGASTSESLDFTGSGLHPSSFPFPYNNGLETSWGLHPNLDGLGPHSVPAGLWGSDVAGLTGTPDKGKY